MEEKIRKQIEKLEAEAEEHKERLSVAVKEFKNAAERYDDYDIVNFIDGYIRNIRYERDRIAAIEEQIRMLVWLGKE